MKTTNQLRIETIIYTFAALTAITVIPAILKNAKLVDGTFPDATVEACELPEVTKKSSVGTAVTAERKPGTPSKDGKAIWVINDVTGRVDIMVPNIKAAPYRMTQDELEDQAIKEALNSK